NRLIGTSTANYSYDNNGNMLTKTDGSDATRFQWDFENRLTQVATPKNGSVTYKYDALDRRIQSAPSKDPTTNFTYDGADVVLDTPSNGATVEYLNGPGVDNKIRQQIKKNKKLYFSQDHLGSTTGLTDE